MESIKYIKLHNDGAFVARIKVLWTAVDAKGVKYGGEYGAEGYDDICAGAERTLDLAGTGVIPNGAEVWLKAFVVLGKDNEAAEKYIFNDEASKTAEYKISGTTLSNTLELLGCK